MSVLAGVGITPRAGEGDDPIGEARRAEGLGLDAVNLWARGTEARETLATEVVPALRG